MPEIKCMICGEEMPEKSYCSNFHKELEMMHDVPVKGQTSPSGDEDGYEPDNEKEASDFKGKAGQEGTQVSKGEDA